MRRAGNARVVIADRLFASPPQHVVIQIDTIHDDSAQILLDTELVLRRWRDNHRVFDRACIVDPIAMIQNTARRFGAAITGGGPWLDGDSRRIGRGILIDNPKRFITGIKHFDAANDNALSKISAVIAQARFPCGIPRQRGKPVGIQIISRDRSDHIAVPFVEAGMQGVGV